MRRATLTIAILALVWIGYIAWPIYDLLVLIRAVETRNIGTGRVYFDAVRISLTNQIVDAYARRTGVQISPFARSFASAGLAPAPGTVGITTNTIGTFWQIFENAEYGFGRFEVAGPAVLPAHQRFRLEFRLLQWHWRLVGVTLPENIQNLLADELAKALRK
jgi:Protein of unknown function (DUF2939)